MPKMACRCGHLMNLSVDDNPYEFSLVPEATIGEIGAKIADEKMASAAEFFSDIERASLLVCRCIRCGRIYLGNTEDSGYSLYERVD